MFLIMVIFGMLIQIPYYFQVDFISNKCQIVNYVLASIQSIVITLISGLIPGILMIMFTILIFHRLVVQKKNLNKNLRKEISFLKALVTIDGVFLACYMPYCISIIVTYSLGKPFIGTVLHQVTNYFTAFHNSLDFFVHFFSNKIFRNYCISMFCGSRLKESEATTRNRNSSKALNKPLK